MFGTVAVLFCILQTFSAPSFDDKILEVVAVFGSTQLAVSRVIDLQHHRIAQVTNTPILPTPCKCQSMQGFHNSPIDSPLKMASSRTSFAYGNRYHHHPVR